MKSPEMKAALKKGVAKAKKTKYVHVDQNEACTEVVADMWAIIIEGQDDLNLDDVERLIKDRGVTPEFLQGILDSRKIEKENQRKQALAGLRAAYKKLPKHLREILDEMDAEDLCDEICGVEE